MLRPEHLLVPHRTRLAAIRSLAGIPDRHWTHYYNPLLRAFAGFVQQLPASEAHHHAGAGGLLQHALEAVEEALRLRRGALLPPGASAEQLARSQDAWTYACATAALLHDLGKPLTDQSVTLFAGRREMGRWAPAAGPMPAAATHYRVGFVRNRRYRRHERLVPFLAHHVLPADGLAWLAEETCVLDAWLGALVGDPGEGGPLAALMEQADRISVARDLAGEMTAPLPGARSKPLAQRLLTGLRHLLHQELLSLNRPGAAAFAHGEDLWLVSKRVLDELREHLVQEGQGGIPSRNDRLMDELQQHGILKPNGDRAVWTCRVTLGDWVQELSCLRLPAELVWPDPRGRPPAIEGAVEPVEALRQIGVPEVETPVEVDAPVPAESALFCAKSPQGVPSRPGPTSGHGDQENARVGQPNSGTEAGNTPTPSTDAGEVAPAPSTDAEPDAGRRFLAWLTDNIASGRVEINTPKARLHVVDEGLVLVSPGIFRDFDAEGWQHAQKRFQKLKVHRKTEDGTNIWTCRVAGERRESLLKVFLLPGAAQLLGIPLPPPNPAVTLLSAARPVEN